MCDLRGKLLTCKGFEDNEFLDKYCYLIESNRHTKQQWGGKTNKHHIIPKSWFKLNSLEIDNSLSNLVNLPYRSHVLAHYYLCLCTCDQLKFANELALICLVSRKKLTIVDKQLIASLPMYNNIYEEHMNKRRNSYNLYEES